MVDAQVRHQSCRRGLTLCCQDEARSLELTHQCEHRRFLLGWAAGEKPLEYYFSQLVQFGRMNTRQILRPELLPDLKPRLTDDFLIGHPRWLAEYGLEDCFVALKVIRLGIDQ